MIMLFNRPKRALGFFQVLAILAFLIWNFQATNAHGSDSKDHIVDHEAWGGLLKKYIHIDDGVHFFRYGEVTEADRAKLDSYLDRLQSVRVSELNALEQQAYWINLYNALTVTVILDHYPVESIRDISYGLLSFGPWKEPLVTVEGKDLSLDNIEHDILRPVFKDERVHYAVNCASYGCPNLQTEPFTGDTLERLLDLGAHQYINHPRGVRIESGKLFVSSIYDWYGSDFGDNDEALIQHFKSHADPALREALGKVSKIAGYRYDWSLNEPES